MDTEEWMDCSPRIHFDVLMLDGMSFDGFGALGQLVQSLDESFEASWKHGLLVFS